MSHPASTLDSIRTRVGLCGIPCQIDPLTADSRSRRARRQQPFPFNFTRNPLEHRRDTFASDLQQLSSAKHSSSRRSVTRDNANYALKARNLCSSPPTSRSAYLILDRGREDGAVAGSRPRRKPPRSSRRSKSSYKVGAATFLDVTTARGRTKRRRSAVSIRSTTITRRSPISKAQSGAHSAEDC